jgi:hypothetical protein
MPPAPHFPFSLTKDDKNTHLTLLTYLSLNYGKNYTCAKAFSSVFLGGEYFLNF